MGDVVRQLESIVGEAAVLTGSELRERVTSIWDPTPIAARALVKPANTQEVSKVLELCNAAGQSVIIFGGQTGGVEGLETRPEDICLSLERMNVIEEIDPVGRTAIVQAGCILQTLQEAVESHNLLFALDLGGRGSCQIGGNVATNACGLEVLRYGMMREQVLGLEAVLADGTVISSMNRMLKNNTGFDLKQLFIGSEGLLGVVTRVVVRLHERMSSVCTALASAEEFDGIIRLLKHADRTLGGTLTRFELMSGAYYHYVTGPGWHRAPLERHYTWYVIVESTGADQQHDPKVFEAMLDQALEQDLIQDCVITQSRRERDDIWTVRENFEPILENEPFFLYDISLPIVDMENYVRDLQRSVASLWPDGLFMMLGHIGDCNLHIFIHPRACEESEVTMLHSQVDELVYAPLKALDGSVSAEHGIGFEKKAWLPYSRTEQEMELMRTLKRVLDPNNILMPGRIFDC